MSFRDPLANTMIPEASLQVAAPLASELLATLEQALRFGFRDTAFPAQFQNPYRRSIQTGKRNSDCFVIA